MEIRLLAMALSKFPAGEIAPGQDALVSSVNWYTPTRPGAKPWLQQRRGL
jgi:hypothetical protein